MIYKTIGCLLKLNNESTKNETEQADAPEYAATTDAPSVVNRSKEVHRGVIVTTGAVDNRKEHKRADPRGSPSKCNK